METTFSAYIAMSLDGYIAKDDGGLSWLERVHQEGEDYGFQTFLESVDVLLMGRKTYESVLASGSWPYVNTRVIILSQKEILGREVMGGSPQKILSKLKEEGVQHVYLDGGLSIAQFLAEGLVNRLTLSIIPVLLGSGIPLFHRGKREFPCRLLSSKAFPSGLVQLHYEVLP